jgi:hypothetical protein
MENTSPLRLSGFGRVLLDESTKIAAMQSRAGDNRRIMPGRRA